MAGPPIDSNSEHGRLDSWKQIAGYLDKSERTVRRWQQTEGMPVHKHLHSQRGSVWAYQHELDEWLAQRRISPEPLVEVSDQEPEIPESQPRKLSWAVIVAVMGTTFLGAGAWLFSYREPEQRLDPVPFTALPGMAYGPSFSPDGRQVVFFWGSPEASKRGLYLKELDSQKMTPLLLTPDGVQEFNYSPAWSPDGRTIAFLRRTAEKDTWLYLISSNGGPERRLIKLASFATYFANHQHVSWSRDSQWLLAGITKGNSRAIHRISLDGAAKPVTDPAGTSAFSPIISPNGRSFVYLRREGSIQVASTAVLVQGVTTDGNANGNPESIYKVQGMSSGIAWMPNGKDLVICTAQISVIGPSENRLYMLPAQAGARMTPIGLNDCSTVTVSGPDANGSATLLYGSTNNSKAKLWIARLDAMDHASEFAPSSRHDSLPAYAPSGALVAFLSNRSGRPDIWIARKDGSEPKRLTENGQARSRPEWSPDGNHLLYGSSTSTSHDVSIVPLAGGKTARIPLTNPLSQDPVWSADGSWIYYVSGTQLWRSRPDGSGGQMIQDGGRHTILGESPDGKYLYYTKPTKHFGLFRIPSLGGKEELLQEGLGFNFGSVTKLGVYFFRQEDAYLCRLPFDGGPVKQFAALSGPDKNSRLQKMAGFTVSPDDSTIIWAVEEPQQVDLEMIRNFR